MLLIAKIAAAAPCSAAPSRGGRAELSIFRTLGGCKVGHSYICHRGTRDASAFRENERIFILNAIIRHKFANAF